jgi:hypothetical protein
MNQIAAAAAVAALAGAFVALPALANEPSTLCRGQIAVVRVSMLTPNGTRAAFDRAVADQQAWYRSHGFSQNSLTTSAVIARNPQTREWAAAPREIVTMHINPPPISAIRTDAAWNAFVAAFKANAQVVSEKTICLERPL